MLLFNWKKRYVSHQLSLSLSLSLYLYLSESPFIILSLTLDFSLILSNLEFSLSIQNYFSLSLPRSGLATHAHVFCANFTFCRMCARDTEKRFLYTVVMAALTASILFPLLPASLAQYNQPKTHLTIKICHVINPLNPELNPICYLLALLGAHRFLHVSRIRVKSLTLRRLMSYIYGVPILDVSRSHTTTQHSR
jgi:hypothetical protein